MATVVVQITAGIRLFQHQPALAGGDAASPDTLRHAEYLERLLLAGRLDGARELALELALADDPFIGCLSGYVLLRLGLFEELGDLTERTIAAARSWPTPTSCAASTRPRPAARPGKQAFAEAIGVGIPLFGEGLTRLLEGLRTHGVDHPRAAIVRYVFQNHCAARCGRRSRRDGSSRPGGSSSPPPTPATRPSDPLTRLNRRLAFGALVAITAAVVAGLLAGTTHATARPPSVPKPHVVWKPVPFDAARRAEMAAYVRRHYGRDTWRPRKPQVIVEHYTATRRSPARGTRSRATRPTRS